MKRLAYIACVWAPALAAGALFGWRGLVWGFIATACNAAAQTLYEQGEGRQ